MITEVRNVLYTRQLLPIYQSSLPVISIGNLTLGGNGKTPLVLWLAEQLQKGGKRPAILSRGYGARIQGVRRVFPTDSYDQTGDEPLLMARTFPQIPVVVAPKRAQGAQYIEVETSANLILLDDGLQHRALARNCDLLCINVGSEAAVEEFLQGRVLPEGMFREPREKGLTRIHGIILSLRGGKRREDLLEKIKKVLPLVPTVESTFEGIEVWSLKERFLLSPTEIVAFCALGDPTPFFDGLRESGFSLIHEMKKRDHEAFSIEELEKMKKRYPGVPLVCSQKDAVKLPSVEGVYQAEGKFVISDPSTLLALVDAAIKR